MGYLLLWKSAAILSNHAERMGFCKDCIFLLGMSPLCAREHHNLGWAVQEQLTVLSLSRFRTLNTTALCLTRVQIRVLPNCHTCTLCRCLFQACPLQGTAPVSVKLNAHSLARKVATANEDPYKSQIAPQLVGCLKRMASFWECVAGLAQHKDSV